METNNLSEASWAGGTSELVDVPPLFECSLLLVDTSPSLFIVTSSHPSTREKMDLVNQPVVIDNGSGTIKAGFAGGQVPKSVFSNLVARPKHVRVMAGGLEGDTFIGAKAEEHRGLMTLKYPMEHGIVTDWNEMERIWHYIYSKEQLQTFPEEHPVLLTGKWHESHDFFAHIFNFGS